MIFSFGINCFFCARLDRFSFRRYVMKIKKKFVEGPGNEFAYLGLKQQIWFRARNRTKPSWLV